MYRTLSSVVNEITDKVVAIRVDINVTFSDKKIIDNTRIKLIKDTFDFIIAKNPRKIILISHLGRPKGVFDAKYSLIQLIPEVSDVLRQQFHFASSIKVAKESDYKFLLLENIRFLPGEEQSSNELAKELAEMCDIYINDAFSVSHRAHASVYNISKYKNIYMGLLFEKEVYMLNNICRDFKDKIGIIIGGSKISTKIDLVLKLSERASFIAICGAMANTFLKALGNNIGLSLHEEAFLNEAGRILNTAKKNGCQIILPKDVVVTKHIEEYSENWIKSVNNIESNDIIADIGPETIYEIAKHKTNMIVWNGPAGIYEVRPYNIGTDMIARMITNDKSIKILGGGDVVAAVKHAGLLSSFDYISSGGGAFLEYLEGKDLPGIQAVTL